MGHFQAWSSAFAATLNQAVKMYLHPITCDRTSPEGIEINRYGFLESGVRLWPNFQRQARGVIDDSGEKIARLESFLTQVLHSRIL